MKKILLILGGLIALFLISSLVLMLYSSKELPNLSKESKVWADETIPKIITTWDVDLLIKNASPDFLKTTSAEDLKIFFKNLSLELGTFKKYIDSRTDQTKVEVHGFFRKEILSNYIAAAEYDKQVAQISVTLTKEKNEWKILGFHVNLPKMPN